MSEKNQKISLKPTEEELAFAKKLTNLIFESPCNFWAVKNQIDILQENGFKRLSESEEWNIQLGGKYFVTRNQSALIAFIVPDCDPQGFMMVSSHCDFPALKLKHNAETDVEGKYTKLNVEIYGGPNRYTWFDSPLGLAGRIYIDTPEGVESRLVKTDRPVAMIPSLSYHQHKNVNEGFKINDQIDMEPLYGGGNTKSVLELIADIAGVSSDDIIETELYAYRAEAPTIWGAEQEFISTRAIDDQTSVFGSLFGFLEAKPKTNIAVHAVFDNEEIGSQTHQGAASNFLENTWIRITKSLGKSDEIYTMLENSMTLCSDNGHALHPNKPEITDPSLRTYLGGGPVIKYSAKFSYTTDAVSGAIIKKIAAKHNIALQEFVNRSDAPGGSALGVYVTYHSSIKSADVAISQLSMHSSYETCGVRDLNAYKELTRCFYSTGFVANKDGEYTID